MNKSTATKSEPIARYYTIIQCPKERPHFQGGPFAFRLSSNQVVLGPKSIVYIGNFGMVGATTASIDLSLANITAPANSDIYCKIPFQFGWPITEDIQIGYIPFSNRKLPMLEYDSSSKHKFSPYSVKSVSFKIGSVLEGFDGWEQIYGKESSLKYVYNIDKDGKEYFNIYQRRIWQPVQIIESCFGFIATSAVAS